MINVLISKSKRKLRSNFYLVGIHLTDGESSLTGNEKENFMRKRALISKGERNIEENIITNQVLKNEDFFFFLGKQLVVLQGKTTANVGHVEK